MSKIRIPSILVALFALAVLVGCGEKKEDTNAGATTGGTTSLADCTPDTLDTHTAGKLTIATDKPAYPPYFEDNDPTNGKGFESAVGYAIADKLGYTPDQVDWVVEPFNASYSPGPKDFDFDVNQISISPKRAEQVDFSSPYYTANQAIVALKDSPIANATSLADLADAKIGVQIGTTSLDAVNEAIQPSNDPQVFDNSNDVVSALKNGQVDSVVVDLPTALYLTAAQVPTATVVGQFESSGKEDEWGALLQKGSSLTPCVSAAIDDLQSSGELPKIEKQWMSDSADAPILQ